MYRRNLFIAFLFSIYLLSVGCSDTTRTMVQTSPVAGSETVALNIPSACAVYGQLDFTISTQNAVSQHTLSNPSTLYASSNGGFYVADYSNNRVLHFPATHGRGAGPQADMVYGQPDFFSKNPTQGMRGLNSPHGVVEAPDGGLYVSDMLNNRVLHYPAGKNIADLVYGQPDFTTHGINTGGLSAASLYHPQGLATDHTGLYVADSANNRVVHYPIGSVIADMIYGQGVPGNNQPNFTRNSSGYGTIGLNDPRDVVVNNTGLYVADSGNNRVLHYSIGNPLADYVYGQPNFLPTSTLANQGHMKPDATTLNNPTGLTVDRQSRLFIADRNNNRVLSYPPFTPISQSNPAATQIYGQIGYDTNNSSTSDSTFNGPGAVAVDMTGNLLVLDIFNQRVLKFCNS